MGTCPSCGASGLFFRPDGVCVFCGNTVCDRCVPVWHENFIYKTKPETTTSGAKYTCSGFCSQKCYDQFCNEVENYSLDNKIGTDMDKLQANTLNAWNQAILGAVADFYESDLEYAVQIHSEDQPAFSIYDEEAKRHDPLYMRFYNKAKLALAKNLEKCGRTQDAAKIFEELQIYDKSRELRQQDRNIIIKNTNVSVNLNSLLQQVKDGGIVAVFRCPVCGGKLKVNQSTTLDSLKKCEHCDSDISTLDLADFLKTIL